MAHSFGSTVLARSSAATSPITRSATTAAGDTVLVLMLEVKGATNRAGGAPTFNGVEGIQANSTQKAATSPEASCELWYWTGSIPSGAGSLFIGTADIVIPNTGTATIFSSAHTGQAGTGKTSAFDAANGNNATSSNPTTNAIVSTVNGAIYFAVTAGGWQTFAPSGRTGTSLYETDDGATGGGGQYFLQTSAGSQAMSWTFGTSDDWGAVGAAFKEVDLPVTAAPGAGGLTLAGTVGVLALATGIAAGALGLTGPAPSLRFAGPGYIDIPTGSLLFKGPASPPPPVTISPNAGALGLTGHGTSLNQTTPIGSASLSTVGQGVALAHTLPVGSGTLTLTGTSLAGGSGSSIEIGSGALAWTGYAPTLGIATVIQIPAGELRFKGPARQTSFTVTPAAGALAFGGPAPSVQIVGGTVTIPIAAGALTLSGQTPQRLVGLTIAIGAGTLTLDGKFVGQVFGNSGGSFNPAALVFTGYAPTVSVQGGGTNIAIPAGALTLTGRTPALAFTVPLGSGVLALSGQALSIVGSGAIAPDRGVLTLTGLTPTVQTAVTLPAGTLSLAGQAPSLNQSTPIGAGTLTFTGRTPTLLTSGAVSPDAAVLSLIGPAPTLKVAFTVPIGAGTLSLSGPAPVATPGRYAAPGAGTLTLVGLAPGVSQGTVCAIPAGSLALVGPDPLVVVPGIFPVGAGALTFTGHAPSANVLDTSVPPASASLVARALTEITLTGRALTEVTLIGVKRG